MAAHPFGDHIRQKRLALLAGDNGFSLRRLASRLGIQASYLSRLERGAAPSLSEANITALAAELDENPDVLLALAGKIPQDVRQALLDRPELFAPLVRTLADRPDSDLTSCLDFGPFMASFRETQRLARVGSFSRDLVTGRDYWSEEFFRIFGLPPGSPTPTFEEFLDFAHPEDRALLLAVRRKALAGKGPIRYCYRFRREDGVWRHAKAVARVECDTEGRPIRIYGMVQDVTTERQALDNLRSVARFPEDNPHPVLRVTKEGLLAYANSASRALLDALGLTLGQPVGAPFTDVLARAMDTGHAQELDLPIGPRILAFTVIPLLVSGHANLYGRDVTNERAAQQKLAETPKQLEERFDTTLDRHLLQAILETTADSVVFISAAGRFLRVNSAFARAVEHAFDGDPDRLIGLHLSDIFDADTARKLAARDAAVIADGTLHQEEQLQTFITSSGVRRAMRVTRGPLRDASGKIIGVCALGRDVTEWRQAAEALAESEARYHRLVDDAVLGVFRATASGRILSLNPAMARLFGYESPDEMLSMVGRDAAKLYEDPERRTEIVRRLDQEGGLLSFENPYRRKDGSIFIGNLHARLAMGETDEPVVEGFVEDITARKRVENELTASEERLKTHLRNFPLPTLTFRLRDRELVLTDANKAAEALFRGRIGTCLEAPAGTIFDEAPDVYLSLWSAFEGRRSDKRRLSFRPPGAAEPGIFDMTFVFAAPDTVMLHAEELTALARTREALRRTSDQLRGILDHVPCAIYFKDTDGRCIMVNRAVEELFGLPAAEIVGQTPGRVHDPEVAARIAEDDRKVLASGQAVTFEEDVVAKGQTRRYLTTKVPLHDAQGAPYALCGMSLDITPLNKLEQDIKAERDTLRTVLDYAPYAASLVATDGRTLFLNQRFIDLVGYTLEDIPDTESWLRKAYPNETLRQEVRDSWQSTLGNNARRAFPVRCGDGDTRMLDFTAVSLPDGRMLLTISEVDAPCEIP
jgi:PAS domain S-box-containing protein